MLPIRTLRILLAEDSQTNAALAMRVTLGETFEPAAR